MDMTDSMAVSVTALDAQRRRLNVISSNLANAQSTHTPGGGPYKRRDVVFQSTPVASPFQRAMRQVSTGPGAHALDGVKVLRVQEDTKPGQVIYDPRHPDADKKGFVKMPNVNVMEEMVNMIGASRSYEANVQAINATRAMWNKALEIGEVVMDSIKAITIPTLSVGAGTTGAPAVGGTHSSGFMDTLQHAISQANDIQMEASQSTEALMTGQSQNVHQTMVALQEADVSFQLMMQIRNKLVSAYEEIQRMQI